MQANKSEPSIIGINDLLLGHGEREKSMEFYKIHPNAKHNQVSQNDTIFSDVDEKTFIYHGTS